MAEDTKTPQPEPVAENDVEQLVTAPSALNDSTAAEPELDEELELETDDETTPEDDDEPDKKGLAKKLEKNNYEFRNFQREMRDTMTKLQESIAGIKPATAKEAEKLDDIKDDLNALFDEKRDEMDNLSVAEARIMARKIDKLNKRLDETVENAVSPIRQQNSAMQEQQDRANFARENPELAPKYDTLLAKARTRLQQYPTGESRRTAAQFIWRDVVNEAKTAKTPQPRKPVPGANPLRSSAAASRGTPTETGEMTESDYNSLIESPRP